MSDERAAAVAPEGCRPGRLGFIGRLVRTPLIDLARGKITGSMDARRQATQLPQSLAVLVVKTLRGTRLRHSEQHAIAEELIAHFQDGLAAGEGADDLVRRFGDPAVAAPLLRRAGLLRRSHPRRLARCAIQTMVVVTTLLILGYLALVVRHVVGRPTITEDYLARLNADAMAIPEADRAWPLYRSALLQLEPFPDNDSELSEQAYLLNWPQIANYLQRNRPAFELAREAAARPHFGFWHGDPQNEPWLEAYWKDQVRPDERTEPLMSLATPHIDELARLRRLLLADSRRALASGESHVFLSNLHTLLGMARHLRDGSPSILTELRAFACYGTSLQLAGTMLADKPGLLTDEELVDLRIASPASQAAGRCEPTWRENGCSSRTCCSAFTPTTATATAA